eukprot:2597049-Pyramimonas_sp.AAC.1
MCIRDSACSDWWSCADKPPCSTPCSPPAAPLRSLLLGILGVRNAGNTAFWTFMPLVYCTTNPDGCVPNEGSTSE